MKCEIYRHYDKGGILLYVGLSISSVVRLANHRSSARWYDRITRIEIERFENLEDASLAEMRAIREENPAFNIIRYIPPTVRDRNRRKRLDGPGRPRIEDRDKTLAATKPWLALGMSQATWYRRQAEKRK